MSESTKKIQRVLQRAKISPQPFIHRGHNLQDNQSQSQQEKFTTTILEKNHPWDAPSFSKNFNSLSPLSLSLQMESRMEMNVSLERIDYRLNRGKSRVRNSALRQIRHVESIVGRNSQPVSRAAMENGWPPNPFGCLIAPRAVPRVVIGIETRGHVGAKEIADEPSLHSWGMKTIHWWT